MTTTGNVKFSFRTVQRLEQRLIKIETALIVALLGAMVMLAFAQVLLRNLFGTSFLWGDTVVRHLVLWTGFVGAAVATHEKRHIGIDALTRFMSPGLRNVVGVFTNLFAVTVSLFLARASWTFLLDEYQAGGFLIASIPTWSVMVVIPLGYLLLALHFCVRLLERSFELLGRRT